MKPEAPKFIVVYQDNPNGYCYSLRNSKNEYASLMMDNGPIKRVWRTAAEAELYITKWAASDLVWVAYTDGTPPIKHVRTAATRKPTHSGYPDAVAISWSGMGNVTGRIPSKLPALAATYDSAEHMCQRWAEQRARMAAPVQPLVWPVIPQVDDGSNEEPSTIPFEALRLAREDQERYSLAELFKVDIAISRRSPTTFFIR